MEEENVEPIRVSVYGTLRQGFGNHRLLENARFLGQFTTEPIFSLYNLGGFPGLKQNGETAVVMEVYEVTAVEARRVDNLEGYTPGNTPYFYDKINIETPYGTAGTYIYVPEVRPESIIESGDYTTFINDRRAALQQ